MSYLRLLFHSKGRITRQEFWMGLFILVSTSLILLVALALYTGVELREFTRFPPSQNAVKLLYLLELLAVIPGSSLVFKRLNDLNKTNSRLYMPATFVFLMATAMLLREAYRDHLGTWEQPDATLISMSFLIVASGTWLLANLGFLRGVKGENQYGPDPLSGPLLANHAQEK